MSWPHAGKEAWDLTYTLGVEGKYTLRKKSRVALLHPTQQSGNETKASEAWGRLFGLGEQIRRQTNLTRDDVNALVEKVRTCRS